MSNKKQQTFESFIDDIVKESNATNPKFSFKRYNEKKIDLNLIDNVVSLLNSCPSNPPEDVIKKCRDFIELHRIMENTSARRRLERWATRVIACYLLIVLIVLIINGLLSFFYDKYLINDNIMITILTTTTINIIGLVLIVLKGYFFNDDFKKKPNKKNISTSNMIEDSDQE